MSVVEQKVAADRASETSAVTSDSDMEVDVGNVLEFELALLTMLLRLAPKVDTLAWLLATQAWQPWLPATPAWQPAAEEKQPLALWFVRSVTCFTDPLPW